MGGVGLTGCAAWGGEHGWVPHLRKVGRAVRGGPWNPPWRASALGSATQSGFSLCPSHCIPETVSEGPKSRIQPQLNVNMWTSELFIY